MTDKAEGVRELNRRPSRNERFSWVILCERTNKRMRYVVWYEDPRGSRSDGYYTTSRDDAQAEFERRP